MGGRAIEPSGAAPAVSPDGSHVYTACGGICLWLRDAGTGLVSFAGTFNAELNYSTNSPALSADGAYLYATVANGVAVFARNATTGALTLIQTLEDGVGGIDGLGGADKLMLSPGDAHVYVAGTDGAVAVFSRNGGTGTLAFVEAEPSLPPKSFAISPDGANLYVAYSIYNDSSITVFTRDAGTGALTLLETHTNVAADLEPIAVSPDGAHLYAASASNADGALYSRNPMTGALTPSGPLSRLLVGSSRRFLFSADGMFLYANGYGIHVLARDAGTGALTTVEVDDGYSPSMALSPDGSNLYSGSAGLAAGLATSARDVGTGRLTIVQATTVPAAGLVTVSPDGANIYVAGAYIAGGSGNSGLAASYARDAATGQATFLESYVDGYVGVHDLYPTGTLTVSPDGAHVYMGGPKMGIYSRAAGSGRLSLLDAVDHPFSAQPSDVAISADGAYLYTLQSSALTVLARNAGTGALTTVESEQDGIGGVDGLAGASSIVISPDGAHVYVAGEAKIAAFARDAVTGQVTFLETVGSPVLGLHLTTPLTISPDGAHVYVMGYVPIDGNSAIAVFARQPVTGHLTFAEYLEGRGFGVPEIDPPLHVSPDGALLFADTSAYVRNVATGGLAFIDTGHYSPTYLGSAPSPDGAHIYSASGNALWTTLVGFAGCDAAPMASCRTAGTSAVRIRSSRSVTWRWLRGSATDSASLGNPLGTTTGGPPTDYALCVYQGAGPTLALRALAPANIPFSQQPWGASGAGFKYRDTWRTPEGLLTLKLLPGAAGAAKILAKGAGPHLNVPSLPLALPVRVQLQNSDGECWESTYASSPNNSGTTFVGRQ